MKIALITTHNFPIPYKNRSGEIVITDLAKSLMEQNHDIYFVSPLTDYSFKATYNLDMPCAWGQYPPSSEQMELACWNRYADVFRNLDIVHDFSNSKMIAKQLVKEGRKNVINNFFGCNWNMATEDTINIVVPSKEMKRRGLAGENEYTGTSLEYMSPRTHYKIKDGRVVYLGCDTNIYTPTYNKKDYFLWMGRWHKTRGCQFAIELAKKTGIKLIIAGCDPNDELWDAQRNYCYEMLKLAESVSNITIDLLPPESEHHNKKIKLYQEARAFLYTVQFNEPGGIMMFESLSCQTPIISTNYGSMPETIEHGKTGFICNNTIESFEEALNKINDIDPKTCRQEAIKRFDRKIMAQNYLHRYQEILNDKSW